MPAGSTETLRLLFLLPSAAVASVTAAQPRKRADKPKCKVLGVPSLLHPDLSADSIFQHAMGQVRPEHVPVFSVLTADALWGRRTTQFNATATVWELPFVPLGSNNCVWPKHGFRWLARLYAAAMRQLARRAPRQVAVVMDSQDAFVQGSADEIRDRLRATGKPLVLALETGCARKRCTTPAPQPGEEANSSKLVGIPGLSHINGGVVVGEAHALEMMWRFVANNTFTGNRMSHQHSAQHGIGKFVGAHPNLMAFDRTQRLSAVIKEERGGEGGIKGGEWSQQYYDVERIDPPRTASGLTARHRVVNRLTRRAPCFVHVPGTQEYKRRWSYMNATMRAWDEIARALVPTPSFSSIYRTGIR